MDRQRGLESWQLALVMAVDAEAATIGLIDGSTASLRWPSCSGRARSTSRQPGPPIERADQVLAAGDVIWVEKVAARRETTSQRARLTMPCASRRRSRARSSR